MQELDAEFAWTISIASNDSMEKTSSSPTESEDTYQTERRLEKLIRLGAQTVSADSLLELASNLSHGMIDFVFILLFQTTNV